MKTKSESKFDLKKFEVAKLKNPKTIVGGGGTTTTGENNTVGSSKCGVTKDIGVGG